jgi:hypothetical protein
VIAEYRLFVTVHRIGCKNEDGLGTVNRATISAVLILPCS